QWGGAIALLLPVGFLLGVPFPTALRCFGGGPGELSFLWAANGIASVVASILAVPVAMAWGISRVLWLAGICYGAALVLAASRGWVGAKAGLAPAETAEEGLGSGFTADSSRRGDDGRHGRM
ncbi:MAG: hypothetical protein JW820_14855, partial [Spirochaetales bacterium]|nr:hypothetical protein [Spirochaetales bacterium]